MMEIISEKDGWLKISAEPFSVYRTFDCGQCFRFDPVQKTDFKYEVEGIAFSKHINFAEDDEGCLYVKSSREDFDNIWRNFLSLDEDYEKINEAILTSPLESGAEHMKRAAELSRGIRILRQDRFEALISFIVSQNNNIPRIKKIIAELCRRFGEKIDGGYAFPTPEALAEAGETAIFDVKCGFRAKYIADASEKVASGEIDLEAVASKEGYDDAADILMSIKGVGPKVAACTLLFGFGRIEAFPIDVWIKRVIEKRFPTGLDPKVFGNFAGIAQQYLFYSERYIMN